MEWSVTEWNGVTICFLAMNEHIYFMFFERVRESLRTYLMLFLDALLLCLAKCLCIEREKRTPYRFSCLGICLLFACLFGQLY
jgi:hypothetical protein